MTDQSLDDIFSGKEPEPIERVEPEEPLKSGNEEVTKTEGDARPAKGEKETETPADQDDTDQSWTKKAALDERRKRQALEDKIKKLEEEIASKEKVAEEGSSSQEEQESVSPDIAKAKWEIRVEISRDLMMEKHKDYEEMEKVFQDLAKDDSNLRVQLTKSTMPAKFAYQTAKAYLENKRLTDPKYADEIREQIREEERQKILAEMGASKESPESEKRKKSAVSVPDLVNATSASSGHQKGEESLKDIFKR